jgi:hypothetical protein
MWLILAAAARSVIYVDQSQPDRRVRVTYSSTSRILNLQCVIFALSFLAPRFLPLGKLHWDGFLSDV